MSQTIAIETPASKVTRWRSRVSGVVKLVSLQIVVWIGCLLGIVGNLTIAFAGFLFVRFLFKRQFAAAAFIVLTSPPGWSFLSGGYDYLVGQAALRSEGLPGTTFYNLDRRYRCGRVTSGCIVDGSEWITHAPYNLAVKGLTNILGPMPGTYTGPYPTREEAQEALATAASMTIDQIEQDQVVTGTEAIALDPGVGAGLVEKLWKKRALSETCSRDIKCVVCQAECIILRIPSCRFDDVDSSAAIVLISRTVGRPFAYYSEGDYSHHFPPVWWIRRDGE